MLTNCLAAYNAHLTITVSEIQRYIGRKSSIFYTPLHSTPPLRGFPLEQRHPIWYGKTRMAWLPHGEKISISLFVLAQLTNVTDGRTPHAGNSRAMHSIARQKKQNNHVVQSNYKRVGNHQTLRLNAFMQVRVKSYQLTHCLRQHQCRIQGRRRSR